jgi:hypothetical protein
VLKGSDRGIRVPELKIRGETLFSGTGLGEPGHDFFPVGKKDALFFIEAYQVGIGEHLSIPYTLPL